MELSAAVSDGVQVSSSLDEKTFQELVKHSISCALQPDSFFNSAQEGKAWVRPVQYFTGLIILQKRLLLPIRKLCLV